MTSFTANSIAKLEKLTLLHMLKQQHISGLEQMYFV